MNYLLRTGVLVFLFFLSIGDAIGQDLTNMGRDFWIGYGHHVRMVRPGVPENMQLYITSDVATSGTVEIPGVGFSNTFQVTPGQITTVDIPRSAALTGHGIFNRGIHVTAARPVVVYSFIFVSAISGATLCLPTNTLGRDYYSINYQQLSNEDSCASYFFVVGVDTGTTTVEITPTAATQGGEQAGVPYIITLGQGQIYQALSTVTGRVGGDFTGTRIRSVNSGSGCKKIAVYSGSSKISIGCPGASSSDNLYQQVYPTATWSRKYIAVPSAQNPNNIFRVICPDPGTTLKINNQAVSPAAFGGKIYYQFSANQPSVIEADRPIMVAQYFPTQNCANNNAPGDPEMILLNPVDQNLKTVTLNSMQPANVAIQTHFLNIVLPNNPAAINSFRLDGVSYTNFSPVPQDNGFAYAQISVARGTHQLACDSGFNVVAYGFGGAESYGYSGGARLRNLQQYPGTLHQYARVDVASSCAGSPFRPAMTLPFVPKAMRWRFGTALPEVMMDAPTPDSVWNSNGTTLYRFTVPTWLTAPPAGNYPVLLTVWSNMTDGCSSEQDLDFEWEVYPPAKAAFTALTKGCDGDSVQLQQQYAQQNTLKAVAWRWDLGNGSTSMLPAPALKYAAAGSYTLRNAVINELGCSTDTVAQTVVIHPRPVPAFTLPPLVCAGRNFEPRNLSGITSGAIERYEWQLGATALTTAATDTLRHVFALPGSYPVTVTAFSDKGCSSPAFTQLLTVGATPKTNFTAPATCSRDRAMFFTNSTEVAGNVPMRFSWRFDTTLQRIPTPDDRLQLSHRFGAAGEYAVQLIARTNFGCADTLVRMVSVNGMPIAEFAFPNMLAQCSDQPVLLENRSTIDSGKIASVHLTWDAGTLSTVENDDNPVPNKTYRFAVPPAEQVFGRTISVRMIVASGASCSDTAMQTLQLYPMPQLRFDSVGVVCSAAPPLLLTQAKLLNGLPGTGVYSGEGVNGAGWLNPARAIRGSGEVKYTYTTDRGCVTTVSRQVPLVRSPAVDAGPDLIIRKGKADIVRATSGGSNLRYNWQPAAGLSDASLLQPVASPASDQTYRITATGPEGCTASDSVRIKVPEDLFIPNAFSPNADGKNDYWTIPFLMIDDDADIKVFNRDGLCVYTARGKARWDGSFKGIPLPSGTYVYLLSLSDNKVYKGSVVLIR